MDRPLENDAGRIEVGTRKVWQPFSHSADKVDEIRVENKKRVCGGELRRPSVRGRPIQERE
jgi:hypothetical protein